MERRQAAETYVAPVVAGLLALVTLIGLIAPAIKSPSPHDIPVGLAGPAPAVDQISSAFATNAPSVFTFTKYDTEADARAAVGDAVTGVITAAFTNVFQKQGQALTVETVHTFASGDPHGLILFFVVLAVVVSTLIAQALVGLRRGVGFATQALVVVLYAVIAAPVAMGLATWIAGDYGSGFWAATALVALASAAIGAVVAGAAALLGRPGVALAALVAVLLDLVCSGGPIGSQLLPDAYRWLAPGMPAGQLYSAMRGALYFDGAGVGQPVLVLVAWLAAGVVLLAVGRLARRARPSTAAVPAHAANR